MDCNQTQIDKISELKRKFNRLIHDDLPADIIKSAVRSIFELNRAIKNPNNPNLKFLSKLEYDKKMVYRGLKSEIERYKQLSPVARRLIIESDNINSRLENMAEYGKSLNVRLHASLARDKFKREMQTFSLSRIAFNGTSCESLKKLVEFYELETEWLEMPEGMKREDEIRYLKCRMDEIHCFD